MAYLMTEDDVRRDRIRWNLEMIDRLVPGKARWCEAEANRLFNQSVNNNWTDENGKIPSRESWLDTVAECTRIELENWQSRRCAEIGDA